LVAKSDQESPDSKEQGDWRKPILVTASFVQRTTSQWLESNSDEPRSSSGETGNPPRCNPRYDQAARLMIRVWSVS